ncbi:Ancient ubiquitous protein 1 [Acipenser ruthenus]|uniref:Ancient ubiquitous protein 1 n=1 Tax=Acipenser ruthenus TaxID=7906 RepID=A0A444TZ54_ACIRT|nr:Ancient ubiquitous protein 1 [Acipenser ruthenus]
MRRGRCKRDNNPNPTASVPVIMGRTSIGAHLHLNFWLEVKERSNSGEQEQPPPTLTFPFPTPASTAPALTFSETLLQLQRVLHRIQAAGLRLHPTRSFYSGYKRHSLVTKWLPTVSRQDGDSSQEFGNKVQEVTSSVVREFVHLDPNPIIVFDIEQPVKTTTNIGARLLAVKLGVVSTQITRADKAEHLKRKRHIAPHTINSMQTNCVDTTIANLLEGAEEMNSGSSGGSSVAAIQTSSLNAIGATASAPALKPAAESFGRSTADRHMSLQDRKEALYEYARRYDTWLRLDLIFSWISRFP